jgi:hypothetical protein
MLRTIAKKVRSYVPLNVDVSGFSPDVANVVRRAAKAPFNDTRKGIKGWLTWRERKMLYGLARYATGPIIEVGSWVGLSTIAIAQGIRDSAKLKPFTTFDLPTTLDNFRKMPNGNIGFFVDHSQIPFGQCSEDTFNLEIRPIVSRDGGARYVLLDNLAKADLLRFVTVVTANFKSVQAIPSGFVFCDALHDEGEINANASALLPFLRHGSILACHDVGRTNRLVEKLCSILPIKHGTGIDSLYVAEVEMPR